MAKGKKMKGKIPVSQKGKKSGVKSAKVEAGAAYSYINSGDMPMGSPDVRRAE